MPFYFPCTRNGNNFSDLNYGRFMYVYVYETGVSSRESRIIEELFIYIAQNYTFFQEIYNCEKKRSCSMTFNSRIEIFIFLF